jgi:hypothetical protein
VAETSANIAEYDLRALCDFTLLLVGHGREYAKEGQKDYARDIARFVRNARILPILKASGCGLSSSLSKLETDLNWLALECHPEDVPNFKPDLAAIRASLERIEAATHYSPCEYWLA